MSVNWEEHQALIAELDRQRAERDRGRLADLDLHRVRLGEAGGDLESIDVD